MNEIILIQFGLFWKFGTKIFPYPPFKNHKIIDLDGATIEEEYGYSTRLEGASLDILWKFYFSEKRRYNIQIMHLDNNEIVKYIIDVIDNNNL